jgi:ribonuclease HI
LDEAARAEIAWWSGPAPRCSNGRPFTRPQRGEPVLVTDASDAAWGAVLHWPDGRQWTTQGAWSENELQWVRDGANNRQELQAVVHAVMAWRRQLAKARSLTVRSDNTTAVAYVRGCTRVPALTDIAEPLLRWSFRHRVDLRARHLPGAENGVADALSRQLPRAGDYMLRADLFAALQARMGAREIDLFADRRTARLPRFCAWRPDPRAEAVDAFSLASWRGGYAHPPVPLVRRVLLRVRQERCAVTAVLPWWPTATWWPELRQLLVSRPVALPDDAVLPGPSAVQRGRVAPPMEYLQLVAVVLSGHARASRSGDRLLDPVPWEQWVQATPSCGGTWRRRPPDPESCPRPRR